MKKRILVGLIIFILLVSYFVFEFFSVSDVYLYITDFNNSDVITLNVDDGQGHYKFKKYKLTEIEQGVYQIQGYGSLLSGEHYPLQIQIDNKDGHIKKLMQKNLDGNLETVLESD